MLEYYESRQPEYERIYSKPERQSDLGAMEDRLLPLVDNRKVLELACGTGYWTRRIAAVAQSVLATDGSQKLAESARDSCASGSVTARALDAFNLPKFADIDCVVAGFFYSHVERQQQAAFLRGISQSVSPGCRIILFDNRYVAGSSTPISRESESGDTYQLRSLDDGTQHEVLKNFPTKQDLVDAFSQVADQVEVVELQYFWIVSAINRQPG